MTHHNVMSSYWRPAYRPDSPTVQNAQDAAEKSPALGVLGACVVCRSIAYGACATCRARVCDTVCLAAHRLDHAAPLPVAALAPVCKRCGARILLDGRKGRGTVYCSRACSVLANRERWKKTASNSPLPKSRAVYPRRKAKRKTV